MVIYIIEERSRWAREAARGQEEAGVREEAEGSGKRLRREDSGCDFSKERWGWSRASASLTHPVPILWAGSTPVAGIQL